MRLRGLPGAAALGLLAALLVHAAAYGTTHVMGADFHGAFLALAGCAGFSLFAILAALALLGARTSASGSILAARLRAHLPNWFVLAVSTIAWFSLIEGCEPKHGQAPTLVLLALVAGVAWLVLGCARALLALLARIAFGILWQPAAVQPRRRLKPAAEPPIAYASPARAAHRARPPPVIAAAA
ncbi:MAG: hypothetical protein ACREMP_10905 [Candidatus Tyrphobacter sp.]